MITEDEAAQATYSLADFGSGMYCIILCDWEAHQSSAQPSGLHTHHTITPLALRPPEAYLGGEWDKPTDIWTFGCLVSALDSSTGRKVTWLGSLYRYSNWLPQNISFAINEIKNLIWTRRKTCFTKWCYILRTTSTRPNYRSPPMLPIISTQIVSIRHNADFLRYSFINILRFTQEEPCYVQMAHQGTHWRVKSNFRRGSYRNSKVDRAVLAPRSITPVDCDRASEWPMV
jgi:hypothetical protein